MRIRLPFPSFRQSRAVILPFLGLLLFQSTLRSPGSANTIEAAAPPIEAPKFPLEVHLANGAIQGTALLTAFPIKNIGNTPITNLTVTAVTLQIGSTTTTGTVVGGTDSIAPGVKGASFGSFPSSAVVPGDKFLTIVGSFVAGGQTSPFSLSSPLRVAPVSPGSATAISGTLTVTRVIEGPYPATTLELEEANEEQDGWVVPLGPVHPLTHSAEVGIEPAPPTGVDPPVEIYKNNIALTGPAAGAPGGFPAEPSGATAKPTVGGNVALLTSNAGVLFSIKGGRAGTWTPMNPTTMFPPTLGGFCCDQVVQYVPGIDKFVWLMEYFGTAGAPLPGQPVIGPNLERIAVASPAGIIANVANPKNAWSFFDITPGALGLGTDFFDYPDLAVGDGNLYVSFDDIGFCGLTGSSAPSKRVGCGLEVVRVSLTEVKNVGDTTSIGFQGTHPLDGTVAYGSHLTQNAGDTVFWAGHNSNSSMRIFSWPEATNDYSWQDIDIGSWSNNPTNLTATTPDKVDWLTKLQNFPGFAVLGSARGSPPIGAAGTPQVYFAWTAASGGGFPFPQVQWVTMGINPITLETQRQLWKSNTAVAYPALSSNSNGEVGISAETGGGARFENHAIGFLLDGTVYATTASNLGVQRYGDYVTIRQDALTPGLFDAFGYAVRTPGVLPVRFVVFGRPPVPTYDQVSISLATGNDDAGSGLEVIGQLSGQNAICLKQSDSIAPDAICPGNGNSSPSWNTWTSFSPVPFPLNPTETSIAGFGTFTLKTIQSDPTCVTYCDNWDLQAITVTALDSTDRLPPLTLINMSQPSTGTDNCIARLKGAANGNATTVQFGNLGTPAPTHVYVGGTFAGESTDCKNNGDGGP